MRSWPTSRYPIALLVSPYRSISEGAWASGPRLGFWLQVFERKRNMTCPWLRVLLSRVIWEAGSQKEKGVLGMNANNGIRRGRGGDFVLHLDLVL